MAVKINGTNSNSAVGLNNGDEDSGIKPGADSVEIVTNTVSRVTVDNTNTTVSNNLSGTTATFSGLVTGGNSAFLSGASSNGNLNIRNDGDETTPVYEVYNGGFNVANNRKAAIFADGNAEFAAGNITMAEEATLFLNTSESNNNAVIRVRQQGSTDNKFSVTGDGAVFINGTRGGTNPVPGISLNANGVIAVASGGGIAFSPQAAANVNLLDDYEEGTWTPTIGNTGFTYTYGTQEGTYTKIGRLVTLRFRISVTARSGSLSGGHPIIHIPLTTDGLNDGGNVNYAMPSELIVHKAVTSSSAGTKTLLFGGFANSATGFFWVNNPTTSQTTPFDLGADFLLGGVITYTSNN